MYGSMFLIGAALALAGGVGVFLPPGDRAGVVLALLGGCGRRDRRCRGRLIRLPRRCAR